MRAKKPQTVVVQNSLRSHRLGLSRQLLLYENTCDRWDSPGRTLRFQVWPVRRLNAKWLTRTSLRALEESCQIFSQTPAPVWESGSRLDDVPTRNLFRFGVVEVARL